ncbi:protein of unknown function [Pseudomonas sp. JV551A1]|uniref:Uncharacterized protein n=1 Tax=Pseudomonas inefficax TaxID=2078786 RepID=A0AAQ1P712_9PSED|nr:protein of unknown function [Pseudomonas sp. JV551A1]SPO60952.1 protein of unknown function [Pseudomonas inefficax]
MCRDGPQSGPGNISFNAKNGGRFAAHRDTRPLLQRRRLPSYRFQITAISNLTCRFACKARSVLLPFPEYMAR